MSLSSIFNRRKPQQQYFGGSQDAYNKDLSQYSTGVQTGQTAANQGTGQLNNAATTAATLGEGALADYGAAQQQYLGDRASAQSAAGQVRTGINTYKNFADTIGDNYQRTDQLQLGQDLANNQRSLMGAARGSGAGAGAIRAALQAGGQAGATAVGQADVTRANENNTLIGLKNDALQGVNSMQSNYLTTQQNQQQLSQAQQQNASTRGISLLGAQTSAAGQVAQTGLGTQQAYLGASTDAQTAQLNADRETELNRQQAAKDKYNAIVHPFGVLKN